MHQIPITTTDWFEMERPYLSLIIPCYNEAARIHATLDTVSAYLDSLGRTYEIIAVNDGSTDDTHRLMLDWAAASRPFDKLRAQDGPLRIVTYDVNRGKGYAVRQGVFASRGEYVAFSDADLSAPIDQLGKLLGAIEKGYDIAIGSRAAKGAEIPIHQPFYRELGGKGLNLIIRLLAVPGIRDTQCGFKLFRGEAARAIFERCIVTSWGFDVEVLYLARRLGYRIAEIPVKWSHAEGSTIRPIRAGLRAVLDTIRVRVHHYGL